MTTKEFFEALYPNFDKNQNKIEIRLVHRFTKGNIERKFFTDIDKAIKYAFDADDLGEFHVYFECPELKFNSTSGREENIFRHPFLYSDIDPNVKDKAGNIIKTYTKEQLMERIEDFPLPPSIIVDSGGGYHVYWLLEIPLYEISKTKCILSKIQNILDGDKSASLATQLLRVPYTYNRKEDQFKQVKVVEANCKRYSAKDFTHTLNISEEELEQYRQFAKNSTKQIIDSSSKHVYSKHTELHFNFKKKPKALNIQVDNFADLLDTLKRQNIFLASNAPSHPLGQTFHCCFHDDENPSANIFMNNEGYYQYKCFGCGRNFDIISIYQEISGKSFALALVDLSDFFGIDYKYSTWITGQLDKYYHNSVTLVNFHKYNYDEIYPNAYKLIYPRLKYLSLLYDYGLGNLQSEKYSHKGENLFYMSYAYFTYIFAENGVYLDTAKRVINLFCTLGLIEKVPINDLPTDIAVAALKQIGKTAKRRQVVNPNIDESMIDPVNFYIAYNIQDRLKLAEQRAKILLHNGFKIGTTMNKDFLILAFGEKIANSVYPNEEGLNKVNASIAKYLEGTLKKLIANQGYATKDQIVSQTKPPGRLKANKSKKERELNKYFTIILNTYNLEYVRANKKLMEIFGLKKSIYIIIPKGIR